MPSAEPPPLLPIDPAIPGLLDALRDARSVVLTAPPGSGKTTRVPPAIVRSGLLSPENPRLILLQPRRVAARASAERITWENGWTLGEEVGYQVRFERRVTRNTRLVVETEGVLNRQLVADPFLGGVGAVVLDEFHERSVHTDLALAMLREIRETVRDDLILVVMSATLDAGPVAAFLGGCPIITAEGRTFPVEIVYRPCERPAAAENVASAVAEVIGTGADVGDVLVFLPGVEEIRRARSALGALATRENLDVLPLHGSLSADEQARVLTPGPRRKIVLATNVAETSLTIEGVRTVIDTGLARVASYDAARGLDRLELARISRASADQRAGRAGRTAPGRCLRLWSEGQHRGMDESDTPEIARVDLASTVLALHAWNVGDPASFGWFEAPPGDRLASANRLLVMLGAVEEAGQRLTPLGRRLLDLPAHPRIGRLLSAAAADGYPREGAAIAALLSERDIVPRDGPRPETSARGTSDVLVRLELFEEAERGRFAAGIRTRHIDPTAARQVARARDDLLRVARRLTHGPDFSQPDEPLMLRWLLLAFPDRVVRRRGSETTGVMVGGRGVRLAPDSVVREAEFFLALDPREDRRAGALEARVRVASAIRVEWLAEFFPDAVHGERSVLFDETKRRAVAVSSVRYHGLLLSEDRSGKVDPAEASEALAATVRSRAVEFARSIPAAENWLSRLEFLRHAFPEADLPAFDEPALAEVLTEACHGKRTIEELRSAPLVPLLKGRLTHAQSRLLEEQAPEALTVPSGNRVKLVYEPGRPPVLAVRLQELFGLRETPRIASGRVAVVLHVLGPNYRPVQVTDDLGSFWKTTYFQVRKDLRARYPRHAWPDDPLTAKAESKGGRRGG